jgi:hypothetical protein
LLEEQGLRDDLAQRAREWSRLRFDPNAHARRVVAVLVGDGFRGRGGPALEPGPTHE